MASSNNAKRFLQRGEPQVWLTSGALTMILMITATLIVVVMVNGLGVFWPTRLEMVGLSDGSKALGERAHTEAHEDGTIRRVQYKVGNRELNGLDFRWIDWEDVEETSYPEDAVALERLEYGNFYGFIESVAGPLAPGGEGAPFDRFLVAWEQVQEEAEALDVMDSRIRRLSSRMESERLARMERDYAAGVPEGTSEPGADEIAYRTDLDAVVEEKEVLVRRLRENAAVFSDVNGQSQTIALMEIVRVAKPNAMSVWAKSRYYGSRLVELFLGEPRESNTEGGLFPAIFGTVMLVFLMSLFSFPLGVVAGVYLREYAKDGPLVRLVRIGVNNLAGVPSIVYGIFGLGFFVYGIGGTIDELFFPERLPTPTFGTGGILWASLTLGLLTVPVVIVATEEALGAIPQGVREGSLSLGATKFQTLMRILLPMSSPGIMTGFILAMARAAGEVAPLMITGVVKLAPSLPIDGTFPYIHAERKFMHLGFHIYDIGFQSPNVEAAKPMVFVTTLLLVLIVLVMSSAAIYLRNSMKKKYTVTTF